MHCSFHLTSGAFTCLSGIRPIGWPVNKNLLHSNLTACTSGTSVSVIWPTFPSRNMLPWFTFWPVGADSLISMSTDRLLELSLISCNFKSSVLKNSSKINCFKFFRSLYKIINKEERSFCEPTMWCKHTIRTQLKNLDLRVPLTETETDKMATVFNGIGVSVQYEHLNTALYKQFFIGLSLGLGLCQCKCSTWERSHAINTACIELCGGVHTALRHESH